MIAGNVNITILSYSGSVLRIYKNIDPGTIHSSPHEFSFSDNKKLLHKFHNFSIIIDEQPIDD